MHSLFSFRAILLLATEEMYMDLSERRCAVCRADTPTLAQEAIQHHLVLVPGWEVQDTSIERTFSFRNFKEALEFFNKVAVIAEAEDHHPDMCIKQWRTVVLTLTSHAAKGLTENDFIMAAKINTFA